MKKEELKNIIEMLKEHSKLQPEKAAYILVKDDEENIILTYRELEETIQKIGYRLKEVKAKNNRVLVMYPPGLDYVIIVLACLYVGYVAIPCYPFQAKSKENIENILDDANPGIVFSIKQDNEEYESLMQKYSSAKWMELEEFEESGKKAESEDINIEAVAFLQYTSGSVAKPKGVMVTHKNLAFNIQIIERVFELDQDSKAVIWLPPSHDMGLIGGLLEGLYVGFTVYYFPPNEFIQKPLRWLQTISKYQATVSGGPNFAYDLCVQKITEEQKKDLNLSSWKTAFCGAEPIHTDTFQNFYKSFGPCGFQYKVLYPCYGLAEATLLVAGSTNDTEPTCVPFNQKMLENGKVSVGEFAGDNNVTLTSCGFPVKEQELIIVNPETKQCCLENEIGEIWIAGDSVTKGYWEKEEITDAVFHCYLKDTQKGPYLRSGDMGFLYQGELYITGRLKEMLIIRGRNFYPNDIEQAISACHPFLMNSTGVAFSVNIESNEQLVLVYEVADENEVTEAFFQNIMNQVNKAINNRFSIQCYDFLLVKRGEVPKTTSEKVSRNAARDKYLQDEFCIVESMRSYFNNQKKQDSQNESEISYILNFINAVTDRGAKTELISSFFVQNLKKMNNLQVPDNVQELSLVQLGMDSIKMIELVNLIEDQLSVKVPFGQLLSGSTITELSAVLLDLIENQQIEKKADWQKIEKNKEYPLSTGQKSLWLSHKLNPESTAYNVSSAIELGFQVDIPAFQNAYKRLQLQHCLLDVRIYEHDNIPYQVIKDEVNQIAIIRTDEWSKERVKDYIKELANTPFHFYEEPVVKCYLLQNGAHDGKDILLLVMHHIITDFWAMTLILKDFINNYNECCNNVPMKPISAYSYLDYIVNQNKYVSSQEGSETMNFWKEYLLGSEMCLNFPADYIRPALHTENGKHINIRIESALSEELSQYSKRKEVTLFNVLLTAYYAVLYRYTNETDLLVGVPIAGRTGQELSNLVGYCTNTLPVRVTFDENSTLEEILYCVKKSLNQVYGHQDYPFGAITENLDIPRDISSTSIYQVLFVYQESSLTDNMDFSAFALGVDGYLINLEGLSLKSVGYEQLGSQFDFTLMLAKTSKGMELSFQYNTDIYSNDTMNGFIECYITTLQQFVKSDSISVSKYPVISEKMYELLIYGWNQTEVYFDDKVIIPDMFEETSRKYGTKTALICEGREMTFRELDEKAGQLANYLAEQGVRPNSIVSILMDRSFELFVSILGVLKAGGTYAPVDIKLPEDRIKFMIEDAGSRILISKRKIARKLGNPNGVHCIYLDEDWEERYYAKEEYLRTAGPNDMCYLLFTSGSTGKPKGVMVRHGGVANLVHSITKTVDYTPDKKMITVSSVSFDIFIIDAIIPLIQGLTVVVPSEIENKNPLLLRQLITQYDVKMIQTTPSKYKLILDMGAEHAFLRNMTDVIAAGEPFSSSLLELFGKYENLKIYNGYGPTETTVYSTIDELQKDSKITIGRPIDNTYIYILNKHMQPQMAGVPGDLYISGAGVSKGYLNREDLTKEKFVADPFRHGLIMYNTGDRAKWLFDGTIDYLGRNDNQVKLRGYRIEIDEIEKRIFTHPGIKEVVVLLKEDKNQIQYLCAYLVADKRGITKELAEYLSHWLPFYMVPSLFVEMEQMPYTPNGKIDKKKLYEANDDSYMEDVFAEPETDTEKKLANIWYGILEVEQISINSNFFLNKGDSLKAAMLLSKIQREFHADITLGDVFHYPTIKEQAICIEKSLNKGSQELTALSRLENALDYKASLAQKRMFTLHNLDNTKIAYNMPGLLKLEGDYLARETIEEIFTELIKRHACLRTSFYVENGEIMQKVHETFSFQVERVQDQKMDMEFLIANCIRPFELSEAPLIRVTLLETEKKEQSIFIDIFHGVADGVSLEILINEFTSLYHKEKLDELKYSYIDYTAWQSEYLNSEIIQKQKNYWKKQFECGIPVMNLPYDFPKADKNDLDGDYMEFYTGSELTASARKFCEQRDVTLYMYLLASFQVFLSQICEQEDVVTGTLTANRTNPNFQNLVGFFINTIPILTKLEQKEQFISYLDRVKECCIRDLENQEFPYESIMMELKEQLGKNNGVFLDTAFSFHNAEYPGAVTENLKITSYEIHRKISEFDIFLECFYQEDKDIHFKIQYKTSLFKKKTIQRFIKGFLNILVQTLKDPEIQMKDIELIDKREREYLLSLKGNENPVYRTQTVLQKIEEQFARNPERIAVSDGLEQLTCKALNARAEHLREQIEDQEIGKRSVIGFTASQNINMICCILAILKCGCICLPINRDYPEERIRFMIRDSKCKALINETEEGLAVELTEAGRKMAVSELEESNHVIYIIYTSGSTGFPKGVQLCNDGILNHAFTKIRETEMDDTSVVANNLNKCFVASIWQVIAPLVEGARIEIFSEEIMRAPYEVFRNAVERKVTILEVVPSMLNTYLDLLDAGNDKIDLEKLSCILLTGEKVSAQLVNQFYSRYKTPLINAYGQSECSDDTFHYHIPYQTETISVPIGRPSDNISMYILNKAGKLVPAGEKGMLYISGPCLSKGYINREDITKECFIENPFVQGTQMYRTGDVVKLNENGILEYVGRIDRQVKIRGFRVELGEIENVLISFQEITSAAVLWEDKKLSAFFMAGQEVDSEILKEKLAKTLPDYMVPEKLIQLDQIPKNRNGKTDYGLLRQYKSAQVKEIERPANQIEEKLSKIWCDVLKKEAVSVTDSFHELRGDSLIAYMAIYKILQEFKIEIPYKTFFELSSIRKIANYILDALLAHKTVDSNGAVLGVRTEEEFLPFPLTDIQEAYWFGRGNTYELSDISAHGYLEFDIESLDTERLEIALNKLIKRHSMLRAVIDNNGMQKILQNVPEYKVEIYDLQEQRREMAEEIQERIRGEMSHEVLSADTWPLFRIAVSKRTGMKPRMHLSIDMLIVDAYSLNLLLEELGMFYENPELKLPELMLTYRDYVQYKNQSEQNKQKDTAKVYWEEEIKNLYTAPELPLIKQPEQIEKTKFYRRSQVIEQEQWNIIKERAVKYEVTPTAVLLAVYAKVLARWCTNKDFTINTTVFSRPNIHKEMYSVVGDFTTVLLLSIRTGEKLDFSEYAALVQKKTLERMDAGSVSGIEVMREYAKKQGLIGKAVMPVVFTSIMNSINKQAQSTGGNIFEDNMTYAVSQTPQVYLDCQITERYNKLYVNWDSVDELFPDNLLDDMFLTFTETIKRLAEEEDIWKQPLSIMIPAYQYDVIEKPEYVRKEIKPELLTQRFLKKVKESPSATALVTEETTLSYQKLFDESMKVRQWILANKHKESVSLAVVLLNKGWEQIVSVLGILMSGVAYVPVDTAAPEERIRAIIENGSIELVVTNQEFEPKLSGIEGIRKLYLGCEESIKVTNYTQESEILELEQIPEELAYIIYTSGSTGRPKGVMIQHAGAMNTIQDINERFQISENDRIIQLSSLSFDLSVYDIFGMLSVGGRIVIPDKEKLQNPEYWYDLVNRNAITVWNSVPAFMEMLVEYVEGKQCEFPSSLKYIMLSGDKIPMNLPRRIYRLSSKAEVISLGGATEASIWSIIYRIPRDYDVTKPIPYGKSLYNQICYVMDEDMQIQPIGVKGEIMIGGIGVARGYFQDEEKTREKFVIHSETGEYLYKTGDLGKYLKDGNIEILGRKDSMVKLRGYRIELGEIETVLNKCDLIERSAVVLCGEKAEEMQLVAYYIPNGEMEEQAVQDRTKWDGNLIEDPLDRLRFKMKHYNIDTTERTNTVVLPRIENTDQAAYLKRRSIRHYEKYALTKEKFFGLLKCLCSAEFANGKLEKYQYGSAGSLYPVQIYIYLKNVEGLEEGIFYLNPQKAIISKVEGNERIYKKDYAFANQDIFEESAFTLFMIGKMNAIYPMYGSWSEKFCYIEAGAICQLLETEAANYDIGLCQTGGFDFESVRERFHLSEDAVYLHGLIGGCTNQKAWTVEQYLKENEEIIDLKQEVITKELSLLNKESGVRRAEDRKEQLRQYAKKYLPDYMIPSAWVKVKEFPLSSNGKLDYKKLKQYKRERIKKTENNSVPKSAFEHDIYQIWIEELGVECFDMDDNFYDVGGTSIKLVRIYNKICAKFNINFPIVEMFQYASVRKLAQFIGTIVTVQEPADKEVAKRVEISVKKSIKDKRVQKYKMMKSRKERG